MKYFFQASYQLPNDLPKGNVQYQFQMRYKHFIIIPSLGVSTLPAVSLELICVNLMIL